MRYLVAYDVSDDARRSRVAKGLQNFGHRIQFSMFECDLEAVDFLRMHRRLEKLMNFSEDRLHIFPICAACVARATVYGPALAPPDVPGVWVL